MSDWREDLLTSIMDCGYGDLYLMQNCRYDIGEIVEECIESYGDVNINHLVRIMFEHGMIDVECAICERLDELKDKRKTEGELDEAERVELAALKKLKPFEDIRSYHNFIDTYLWIDAKEKIPIYKKYAQKELDNFCEMTGFEITY